MIAHVQAVVGDEAVHARAQDKALDYRGKEDMKVSIFVLRQPLVLFDEVSVQRAAVDIGIDVRLVIGAVRHEVRHKLAKGRGLVPQPAAVKAVTAFLGFCSMCFPLYDQILSCHSINPAWIICDKFFKYFNLSCFFGSFSARQTPSMLARHGALVYHNTKER